MRKKWEPRRDLRTGIGSWALALGCCGGIALSACSAGVPEPTASPDDRVKPAAPMAQPPSDSPATSAAPSVAPPPQTPEIVEWEVRELGSVEHSLSEPVHSLALGRPRVAAIVGQGEQAVPWLFEGGKWRAIPIPAQLQVRGADLESARIYFGRDDKPRIMGARQVEGQVKQLYLRFRGGTWKVEKAEIARLAGDPPAAMWGLLGHADPEVVCKQGDQCIIKRLTGWKWMDAGKGTPRVDLQGKEAFAIDRTSVAILDGLAWREVAAGAKLHAPTGVWGDGDEYWISDAASGGAKLWHGKDGAWESFPSPVSEPGTMWGSGPSDVWLAGAEGLAHYDGKTWVRAAGATGHVAEVFGREGEVWGAGASGVWLVKTKPRKAE